VALANDSVDAPVPRRRRDRTRLRWKGVLAGSLSLLGATSIWWATSRSHVAEGTVPRVVLPAAPAMFDATGPVVPVPVIPVHSARLADRRDPAAGHVPVRVTIRAIGVTANVVAVGVDRATRSMEVPRDIRTVGWYGFGPVPGRSGSAVLVGHVDSSAEGPGVFFRLRYLPMGSAVLVRFKDGISATFRVVGRRAYPKAGLPAGVFARSGSPTLALITCGGPFNLATHHYEDNIVVYAVLAHSTGP